MILRIDVLPDDLLLEIFDFYVESDSDTSIPYIAMGKKEMEAWQLLVHVCRRWRFLVFGSPRRLGLRLFCTPETPAKDTLDVWPTLPLIIASSLASSALSPPVTDNVIAALGQSNQVREVSLWHLAGWQLGKVLAQMQVSFPELTLLHLLSDDETPPAIPDSFLGGSAPRLQILWLNSILFPGLPKLLLSATHLVELDLTDIPHAGYISPEAIVAVLSALSSLKSFQLQFRSPQSHPGWESQSLPPPKRSVLPALGMFRFKGSTEYLEELVTCIDTPELCQTHITFFNQIDFDCPRLAQFINSIPALREIGEAQVQFNNSAASIMLPPTPMMFKRRICDLKIEISCREPDWQVSSIEQVCNFSLHPLYTVKVLYIKRRYSRPVWRGDAIESTLWLQLLLPFTAVKNLYLSEVLAPGIAAAFQELVGSRITDVLPSLENIFVERLKPSGSFQKSIEQFVAARQLLGRPIVISVWG